MPGTYPLVPQGKQLLGQNRKGEEEMEEDEWALPSYPTGCPINPLWSDVMLQPDMVSMKLEGGWWGRGDSLSQACPESIPVQPCDYQDLGLGILNSSRQNDPWATHPVYFP